MPANLIRFVDYETLCRSEPSRKVVIEKLADELFSLSASLSTMWNIVPSVFEFRTQSFCSVLKDGLASRICHVQFWRPANDQRVTRPARSCSLRRPGARAG